MRFIRTTGLSFWLRSIPVEPISTRPGVNRPHFVAVTSIPIYHLVAISRACNLGPHPSGGRGTWDTDPQAMLQASRRFGWSDFISAERWAEDRLRSLEVQAAPLTIGCALGCAGLGPQWRSAGAYLSIWVVVLFCRALGKPPALIAPGRLRNLHTQDARLRRLARNLSQAPFAVVLRAPAFTVSWLALCGIAAFG